MVSALKRVRLAFDDLDKTRVLIRSVAQECRDQAFELTTTETFLAGIATRLLDGDGVPRRFQEVLKRSFFVRDGVWRTTTDEPMPLTDARLQAFAAGLERLREACMAAVDRRR